MFGFETARKLPTKTARLFSYMLLSLTFVIHRQNKEIKRLRAKSKAEQLHIAKLIEDGAPHPASECNGLCDAHIIVQFIRELKE